MVGTHSATEGLKSRVEDVNKPMSSIFQEKGLGDLWREKKNVLGNLVLLGKQKSRE